MRIVICVLMLCAFIAACDDDAVGYLDTSAANYEPDYMSAYNDFMYKVETGLEGSFWDLYNQHKGEPEWEIYENDYHSNFDRYNDTLPWLSSPIQGILGTQPIFMKIHEVTSADGGDIAVFKKEVTVYGNGIMVIPTKKIPAGTYMVTLKIENEGHTAIIKDVFKVMVKGKF